MTIRQDLIKKWAPILEHEGSAPIKDQYRKEVTAVLLENQEREIRRGHEAMGELNEAAPANAVGSYGDTGGFSKFDPVLISLVRRAMPQLIAYDVAGVQPMTQPTGLIFAMKSRYSTQGGTEALFNEADTDFSGTGVHSGASVFGGADTNGTGMATSAAEAMGTSGGGTFGEMAFSIEKTSVTAKTRALKAEYSIELAQDLKAVHGLDAEGELSNILSTEILAEINREVVRTVYATANVGVVGAATAVFNLSSNTDTSGRWQVEKYKSLLFAIERASNKIAKDTRRGKGNMIIVSTDVASALAMTGLLDYNSALTGQTNLTVDDTGNTFAGTLFGRIKVYVDPYSVSGTDYVVVGYKGTNAYDAGLFYCPYVPLQMVRAIDPQTYQPKVGFKTRYGLVANPFATGAGTGALANDTNMYYRKFVVLNINQ